MNTKIDRRQFLHQAAMLSSAVALGSTTTWGAHKPAPAQTTKNRKRKIGSLAVNPIGLGCMSMAGIYNTSQPKEAMVKVIRQAVDNGVDFFDTAEVYGPFYSEEIVGEALRPVRGKVVIASKFGFAYDGNKVTGRNSRPEHIRAAVEGSLKRLQTDTIDLLYLHRMDPAVPIEDIAGAVKDLVQKGKVREFGLSEISPDTIRRAHAVQSVAALQSEYSMLERVMERDILPLCAELGIAFVPWGPVCRGMLTGRFDESYIPEPEFRRAGVPYFTPEALKANLKVTALAQDWAKRKDSTAAQIALAWLLAQKPFIVSIPGTTNPAHLAENIGALSVNFTSAELKEFRTSLEAIPTVGFRPHSSVFQNL